MYTSVILCLSINSNNKPVVRDASVDGDALIADLGVRGVWEPQAMALFDIRVVDTDARSYMSHLSLSLLCF